LRNYLKRVRGGESWWRTVSFPERCTL